ncbi:hypothetical protein, partial [Dickeya solani]
LRCSKRNAFCPATRIILGIYVNSSRKLKQHFNLEEIANVTEETGRIGRAEKRSSAKPAEDRWKSSVTIRNRH